MVSEPKANEGAIRIRGDLQLANASVHLRPIRASDVDLFRDIALSPEIWRFYAGTISTEEDLKQFVNNGIQDTENGTRMVFTIFDRKTNRCAGSTSYGNISYRDRRIEIGWTWLGMPFRGTHVNHNCKYLLMKHAFEDLGFERVEFKTDVLNAASRRALMKEGAREEGILRSHTIMPGGRRRDTIYYSVLANEWETLKRTIFQDLVVGSGT